MRKGHRRVHHLFWYLALPILLVFLFISLPDKTAKPTATTPAGASTAIIP